MHVNILAIVRTALSCEKPYFAIQPSPCAMAEDPPHLVGASGLEVFNQTPRGRGQLIEAANRQA